MKSTFTINSNILLLLILLWHFTIFEESYRNVLSHAYIYKTIGSIFWINKINLCLIQSLQKENAIFQLSLIKEYCDNFQLFIMGVMSISKHSFMQYASAENTSERVRLFVYNNMIVTTKTVPSQILGAPPYH